jgi:hypothetical protein
MDLTAAAAIFSDHILKSLERSNAFRLVAVNEGEPCREDS